MTLMKIMRDENTATAVIKYTVVAPEVRHYTSYQIRMQGKNYSFQFNSTA